MQIYTEQLSPRSQSSLLVLSIDFDDCTDTKELRDSLINYIVEYCRINPQYTEVAVAIGSKRQSVYTDLSDAVKSPTSNGKLQSCSILLTEFTEKLLRSLRASLATPPKVKRVNLLTSDIYNELEVGTTLQQMACIDYDAVTNPDNFLEIPIIDDETGRNISTYSPRDFQRWFRQNIKGKTQAERKTFLEKFGVTLEQFDSYIEKRATHGPRQLYAKNSRGSYVPILTVESPTKLEPGPHFNFVDLTKCLVLYNLLQYVSKRTEKNFDLLHLDKSTEIIDNIEEYYTENSHLIPRGCNISFMHWDASISPSFAEPSSPISRADSPRGSVEGEGRLNPDFVDDSIQVATYCYATGKQPTDYLHTFMQKKEARLTADKRSQSTPNMSFTSGLFARINTQATRQCQSMPPILEEGSNYTEGEKDTFGYNN